MVSSARLLGVPSRRGLIPRKVGRTSTVTWTKQTTVSMALISQPRKWGTVALW